MYRYILFGTADTDSTLCGADNLFCQHAVRTWLETVTIRDVLLHC